MRVLGYCPVFLVVVALLGQGAISPTCSPAPVDVVPGDAPWAFLEPGPVELGSPLGESGRFDNEPLRAAEISRGLWVKPTEVTRGEFEEMTWGGGARLAGRSL